VKVRPATPRPTALANPKLTTAALPWAKIPDRPSIPGKAKADTTTKPADEAAGNAGWHPNVKSPPRGRSRRDSHSQGHAECTSPGMTQGQSNSGRPGAYPEGRSQE